MQCKAGAAYKKALCHNDVIFKGCAYQMTGQDFAVEIGLDGIYIYHFYTAKRESIDAWYTVSTRHDQEYAESGEHLQRILWIHGMLLPTPYAISVIQKATHETPPKLTESNAVILPKGLVTTAVMRMVSLLPDQHGQSVVKLFNNRGEALSWLAERDTLLSNKNDAED